jgi:PIN domain nuclease of toxin-antitoxin system
VNCVLDTHFLLWIALQSDRLKEFPWIARYAPWGVSPVSFLEIQYLHEVGRLEVRIDGFVDAVAADHRFVIDEVPLNTLVRQALTLGWTRDPFDRLLAAHSAARRKPLCSTDQVIRGHHAYLPSELVQ